jgi:peptidoglycan/LPS O-acetylase OafA/YrhL
MNIDRAPGLDGVRGIAALMVFWTHTGLGSPVWGGTGVWLFFVLSGFLLFRPFVADQYRLEVTRLRSYLIRRILRILPLFLVALPVYLLHSRYDGWEWVLRHAALLDADGHFWTVKQELLFYLLLPGFVALCSFGRAPLVLAASAVLGYGLFDVLQIVTVTGASTELKFRIVPFIIGMFLASVIDQIPPRIGPPLLWVGLAGLFVLSSSVLQATNLLPDNFEWFHPYVLWPFVAAVVTGAYLSPSFIVSNPVIKQIGVWGYGIYIWHILVLHLLHTNGVSGWWRLIPALLITLALAAISYRFIEAPAIRWSKTFGKRQPDRTVNHHLVP